MSKFDRAVAALLDGEEALWVNSLIPSRDLATDVGEGLHLVITERRVVFLTHEFTPKAVYWWFWREDLADVVIERRWQNSWINKAIEFMVTFVLRDGETFTGVAMAAGGGKREVKKMCNLLGFPHGL